MSSFAPPPRLDPFIYKHPQDEVLRRRTTQWLTKLLKDPDQRLKKFMVETAVDVLSGNLEHQSKEPRFWVIESKDVTVALSECDRVDLIMSLTFQPCASSVGAVSIINVSRIAERSISIPTQMFSQGTPVTSGGRPGCS